MERFRLVWPALLKVVASSLLRLHRRLWDFRTGRGTLNFADDTTHRTLVDPKKVLTELEDNNFQMVKYFRRYQPLAMRIIGLAAEPFSVLMKKNLYGTWELYGFETIFWARKR